MIEFAVGDLLEADVEALVNTVNCVGVMGRGIALQFKRAFPANYKAYAAACVQGSVEPGRMFVFETGFLTNPKYIINFPTKRHWRGKSRLSDIDAGLEALVGEIRARNIRSIAIPPLGSSLGGLDWREVRPRIVNALSELDAVRVIIYEPNGMSEPLSSQRSAPVPNMTPGRAALVGLMHRYLVGLGEPFVTLLEVHKLLYFLQEAEEPLRLKFEPAWYGPYAENLRHVLHTIEGYYTVGYRGSGDDPHQELMLVPGAIADAEALLDQYAETRARFERVCTLVQGFETPFGLELLATVHWVVKRGEARTMDEIVAQTHAWNERKQQFSRNQIALTYQTLTDQQWVPPLAQPVA